MVRLMLVEKIGDNAAINVALHGGREDVAEPWGVSGQDRASTRLTRSANRPRFTFSNAIF